MDTWPVWKDVTLSGGHMYRMDICDCHLWIRGLYVMLLVDTWIVGKDVTDCHWWTGTALITLQLFTHLKVSLEAHLKL